jgi:nucleoid-associated protein YgaU
MTATSMGRIVVPSLALVAACGAAIAFGVTHGWREAPPETKAAIAAPLPLVSPPASGARDESSAALATAQATARDVAAELAVSPLPPAADPSVPAFDVARIERTGDAVIAGRAAPGATVELLRNGERQDQAVADQSGQFVMVPPRLPAGDYELTLRSRLPDGTQATSKHGVTVALNQEQSPAGALQSHTEAPSIVAGTAAANRLPQSAAVSLPQSAAISQPAAAAAATAPPEGRVSPAAAGPGTTTTVVSRGDSLWRISRLTYGVGERYSVVYRANRDRIVDPNRIYPGQVFVLPKTR